LMLQECPELTPPQFPLSNRVRPLLT